MPSNLKLDFLFLVEAVIQLMTLGGGLHFPWMSRHGEGRRGMWSLLQGLTLEGSVGWWDASLLPRSVVGGGDVHPREGAAEPWVSLCLSRACTWMRANCFSCWMPFGCVAEVAEQLKQGGFDTGCCCCVKRAEQPAVNLRRWIQC